MGQCQAIKRDGLRCSASVRPGIEWCYNHDPARADERKRHAARAGRSRPNREIANIKTVLDDLYTMVSTEDISPKVGVVLNQILNTRIRALDVERRLRELGEVEDRLQQVEKIIRDRQGASPGYGGIAR
jgi:hypothetical protein